MAIDLSRIPSDIIPPKGLALAGELPTDIFDLPAGDEVRPLAPLRYEVRLHREGDEIIVEGTLESRFKRCCVTCLEDFPATCLLDPYRSEIEQDEREEATLDLTTHFREDILLALPPYPRCDQGDESGRTCPVKGPFHYEGPPAESEAQPSGAASQDVWGALDQLKSAQNGKPASDETSA